jgi:hypothetical protein
MWLRSGLLCIILFNCVNLPARGQEGYSYLAGHTTHASNGEKSHGFVDALLMCHDSRPVICYGAQKRPDDKGRFTYLILFAPNAPQSGFSGEVAGKTDGGKGDHADVTTKIKLKHCEIDVAYAYTSDEKTGALKSEKLLIGGNETPTDPAQVFLAVLEGEKTVLKPVKAKITTLPPDLGAEKKDSHPFYLQQTIDALKKDSPEIAAFLAKK